MEKGRLVEWLKQDGDPVQVGEILFTVESDKAVQEVEALESGTLASGAGFAASRHRDARRRRLAYLLKPGEEMPAGRPGRRLPASSLPWRETAIRAPSLRRERTATSSCLPDRGQQDGHQSPRAARSSRARCWIGALSAAAAARAASSSVTFVAPPARRPRAATIAPGCGPVPRPGRAAGRRYAAHRGRRD